jgi:hypothetical protein
MSAAVFFSADWLTADAQIAWYVLAAPFWLEVQACAKSYGSSLGWLETSTNSTQHTYLLSMI